MFDIAFSELALIGVVALVVIGPERLPRVARAAGHLMGRAQRYVSNVKADINREMQLEDLKKMQAQLDESARQMMSSASQEFQSIQNSLEQTAKEAALQAQREATDENQAQLALAPTESLTEAAPEEPSPQLDLFETLPPAAATPDAQASLPLDAPAAIPAAEHKI